MGIKVGIRHRTKYSYDRAIKLWPQIIRLRPAPHSRTSILSYSLNISPSNHFIHWMQDPFGNYQARVTFPDLVSELVIDVDLIADLVTINPFDFFLEEYAETFPFSYKEELKEELMPYLSIEHSDSMTKLHQECLKYKDQKTVDFLVSINRHIYELLNYTIRMEAGVQSCSVTLAKNLGSCRDFAVVMVQLLRHFGLAARFVSGYLVQLTPDIREENVPSGPAEDFTDLHAWVEVFIPGAGWIGLDATSGLFAGEGHIPLACTPNPESAAPLTGATEPTQVIFDFYNKVDRIAEEPRVTKPYSDIQYQEIIDLGHQVDDMLEKGDVRLTMGGEPTFISIKDMESDQWNIAADGTDKRALALKLTNRLKEKFAEQGLLHFGQGKWYPGEPIPRWQYSMYWRKDDESIWSNRSLLADPNIDGNQSINDAHIFIKSLVRHLGLVEGYVRPAYEDKEYYLWEQKNLPDNFDKKKDIVEAKMARQKLIEILERGIDDPSGYILPLHWDIDSGIWKSCIWSFRRDKLYLIPGNSQLGHRLPLDRIPKVAKEVEDIIIPRNHFEDETPLISKEIYKNHITERASNLLKKKKEKEEKTIKTTLSVEVVDGQIHVFLPPLEEMNHFLDLVYSIELSAEETGIPVVLEGYSAPYHEDITKLVVAPDPGVIEVNIHPAKTWKEILSIYDILFDSTAEIGLGTNKYMLDGKHTGTGGGNHITLGGAIPASSPLLRRPDLLRSMVNFWQNHPGLSYLFSSSFIGPTSQAPRVDEGRPDIIYELEIAFKELELQKDPPFWMVDRIFRNLLTDITGNTHRAEFCIDKLYSPDSNTGRLGILELRGFDMPPHKEMCIVQLLLIRSLVAAFWNNPYKNKLINWGTELHDKFMMQHYVREDMHEVVDYLNNNGIAFKKEWLDIFFEFRFPSYGHVQVQGINLILRAGIEPWIVLGEEMSNSGTARFVDSSLERLEVVVEDFNPERYKVLCNYVEVPMTATSFKGKYVAAVRYKAWDPSSALHPTIGVNSPLVFDIYDTWNERSVGGCTYHVMHPGGRNYDTFPINSLEAESRRMTRFWEFNHTPKTETPVSAPQLGPSTSYVTEHHDVKKSISIKRIPVSHDFPHTLDLRRG